MNKLKLYRPGDWAWNTTADDHAMRRFEKAYVLMIRLDTMRKIRQFKQWAEERQRNHDETHNQ